MPKQSPPSGQPFAGRISDWVLLNNHHLIAFNKPAGLPVQPDKSGDQALNQIGAAYAHLSLRPIHRLDRPVSGVVLLAKKPTAQTVISQQFANGDVDKTYLAVVAERPAEDAGNLTHFLRESGPNNRTTIEASAGDGLRKAELSYRYLGGSERYHLLEVKLLTGRKHQIRAQLHAIGCPIRGDRKYGFKRSLPGGVIDLHAWKLAFNHPVSNERIALVAPPPARPVWAAFADLLGK